MSALSEYEKRTSWKYEPIRGSFRTHAELARKVSPDGSYAPFRGSAAVFRPGKPCCQVVRLMRRILSDQLAASGMLAEPLPDAGVHMTLHDLVSPETRSCESTKAYDREAAESVFQAAEIIETIRKEFAGRKIAMVSDRIVNMVSKSLVLMLKPQTEQDYELLLEVYRRFDVLQALPYPLTPHITLAYFKPGVIDGDVLGAAVDFAQINPDNAPVFDFFPEGLTAQSFLDMRTSLDIPWRICFCCDGGLNRSVMAANIVTHLASERRLPVTGEARAAFPNTRGRPVGAQVWKTLQNHGIRPDMGHAAASYLEDAEVAHFSSFAGISAGALERISVLNLPNEKSAEATRFFFGVRDPEYGEVTYEQAFGDLYERAVRYLDAFETVFRKHIRIPAGEACPACGG